MYVGGKGRDGGGMGGKGEREGRDGGDCMLIVSSPFIAMK